MAVVTANLSIILTYIYIQGGMGGGPVLRGAQIPFTVVKLHCWSMSDGGMSHWHMSDTARKDRRLYSKLQKLRAYQYKPTAEWRHSVNVTYFENQGTRSAC